MIGILIISHGSFANGLLDAAEMIMGDQDQIRAAGLQPEDSPENFRASIIEWARELDQGDGVLVLADLFGGSPANAAAYLMQEEIRAEVVTGISLPMLLEVLGARMGQDLDAVAQICSAAASEGVKRFSEVFAQNQ